MKMYQNLYCTLILINASKQIPLWLSSKNFDSFFLNCPVLAQNIHQHLEENFWLTASCKKQSKISINCKICTLCFISVHYQKIIHRDIKPSNLLRADSGEVRDFSCVYLCLNYEIVDFVVHTTCSCVYLTFGWFPITRFSGPDRFWPCLF